MIKEHKVFYVHGDQAYGSSAVVEVAVEKLNELSKKGWRTISVSTTERGNVLLLCVARDIALSNVE